MRATALGIAALALALISAGCGYRLAGSKAAGAGAPQPLWIAPVEDEGGERLFGAVLARGLSREAVDRADVALAERGAAKYLLAVRVNSVAEQGSAFSARTVTREYLLKADVTATLSRPGGEPVWRAAGIRGSREFLAGATVQETEANKAQAKDLLSRDLSREILRRVSLALQRTAP